MKITSITWFLGRHCHENINDLSRSSTLKPLRDFVIIFQKKRRQKVYMWSSLQVSLFSLYYNWTTNFVLILLVIKFWTIIVLCIFMYISFFIFSEISWWILRNKTKLRISQLPAWNSQMYAFWNPYVHLIGDPSYTIKVLRIKRVNSHSKGPYQILFLLHLTPK